MNRLLISFLSITSLIAALEANARAETPARKDVVVAVSNVYIPDGLSSNSNAYVVVSGIFPNGCYQWKTANVHNADLKLHEITSIASVAQGMCIQVLIPFSHDVQLGQLSSGTHILRFMSGDGTFLEKQIIIQ
jgi:hypothetical protein